MLNKEINNYPRNKVKVLEDGHVIGYSESGCVFETKICVLHHVNLETGLIHELHLPLTVTLN